PNAVSLTKNENQKSKPLIFTLISIAHFRSAKDYITLFKAIKILKEKGIQIKLLVLGKTFGQIWPGQTVKNLEIENEIEFKGYVANPQSYMATVDGLVLSSLWEGTPNAVLEAMANKLPVIASNIPPCKDLIENSGCGFLFNVKNPLDLSLKIEILMALSESEKQRLGQKGYQYVKEHYGENKVYKQWESLIYKIL
ncbi:MAG: glycosyltransferase, partial [Flavobacteriaceae bacterium]|nr:glycosyltransferase [Flavobacteriaceae bacterium]